MTDEWTTKDSRTTFYVLGTGTDADGTFIAMPSGRAPVYYLPPELSGEAPWASPVRFEMHHLTYIGKRFGGAGIVTPDGVALTPTTLRPLGMRTVEDLRGVLAAMEPTRPVSDHVAGASAVTNSDPLADLILDAIWGGANSEGPGPPAAAAVRAWVVEQIDHERCYWSMLDPAGLDGLRARIEEGAP